MSETLFEIARGPGAITVERQTDSISGEVSIQFYLSLWQSKTPWYRFTFNEAIDLLSLLDDACDRVAELLDEAARGE